MPGNKWNWLTCVQQVLVEATRLDLELVEVAIHLGPSEGRQTMQWDPVWVPQMTGFAMVDLCVKSIYQWPTQQLPNSKWEINLKPKQFCHHWRQIVQTQRTSLTCAQSLLSQHSICSPIGLSTWVSTLNSCIVLVVAFTCSYSCAICCCTCNTHHIF